MSTTWWVLIHLVGSLLFIPFVKRYSRNLLLVASSLIMAISLTVLGIAMYIHSNSGYEDVDGISWLPLICVITYMLADPIGPNWTWIHSIHLHSGVLPIRGKL